MFKVSDFIYREVVNISDGEKIGFVSDIEFDVNTGNICSIIVPDKSKKLFSLKNKGKIIPWDNIRKIGDDIILVELFNSENQ